jgi:hypothetical protein
MSTSNAPERDNINQDEVTKFWGCEMTHLAPQEKELVVMLWQKLKQRRQNTTQKPTNLSATSHSLDLRLFG